MTTSAERKWLAGFTVLLILLTTIPYVLGYASQTETWKFGGFLMGVEDGNSYIAKMLNGSAGEWLFRTPYTSVPQNGLLAFIPYLLLGKLAAGAGTHDQLIALFQIFRWAGAGVFVFATYEFCALFIEKISLRRLAVVLISCGGGLGWLYFIGARTWWGANLPLEFYSPESFGFLEVFMLPHLAVARGLLLLGLIAFIRAPEKTWTRREMVTAAVLWFGIGFFQPLHNAIGCLLAVMYAAIRIGSVKFMSGKPAGRSTDETKEIIRRCGMILAASAFWILYNFIVFASDPFGIVWMRQNVLLSPPFWSYLLAYGWLLPLTALGMVAFYKSRNPAGLFLAVWVFLLPLLAYAPTNIQRRLVEGEWVAIVILVMIGYETFLQGHWKALIISSAPVFLTSIILFGGTLMAALHPAEPVFLPRRDVGCFKELAAVAPPDALVLADRLASNALPAWANVRTLVGHGPESADKDRLEPQVNAFFHGRMPPTEMKTFLDTNKIQYLLIRAANEGENMQIPADSGLMQVISEPGCRIYSVQP